MSTTADQQKPATTGSNDQDPDAAGASSQQDEQKNKPKTENSEMLDFYAVLGVDKSTTPEVIKKSYRKLVIKWHPDKHPTEREKADEMIRDINNAYETLSNPAKKQAYDEQIAALERKRNGVSLPTSGIAPRMAIPKEFMLCPLGNSQKFIRYQGSNLFVQSREDVKAEFLPFFEKTKFNLYWLPEVNNMCRIRPAATAAVGFSGGMNLTFSELTDEVLESELQLTSSQLGNLINFIAVPSPTMTNAFRFEAAYYPGAYLAYKEPNHLRVIKQMEDAEKTSVDFMLVKYDTMFKYVTMEEVLVPSMKDLSKDEHGYVELDRLRTHESVAMYFRNILGTSVWDVEDFETYFDAHWQQWYYSNGKVKLRTRDEQLAHALRKAKKGTDLAGPIAEADPSGLEKLHLETVERCLMVLWKDTGSSASTSGTTSNEAGGPVSTSATSTSSSDNIQYAVDKLTAQKKLLTALPMIVDSCFHDPSLELHRFVTLDLLINSIEDKNLSQAKLKVREKLAELFAKKLDGAYQAFSNGSSDTVSTTLLKYWRIASIEELEVLLTLPLKAADVDTQLSVLCADAISGSSTEKLLGVVKTARKMEMPLFVETVGRALLQKLPKETLSPKKRDILLCVAEIPTLVDACIVEFSRGQLHKDDFAEVLALGVAAHLDRETAPEEATANILNDVSPFLATPPALIHLAQAASQSVRLSRVRLTDIAKAAPMHIKSTLKTNEVSQLLFLLAKAFARLATDPESEALLDTEVRPHLTSAFVTAFGKVKVADFSSGKDLTKVLLACNSVCGALSLDDMPLEVVQFFEAASQDVQNRVSSLPLPQLLCYTEGLLSSTINFQMRSADLRKELNQLLAFWDQMLTEMKSSWSLLQEEDRKERKADKDQQVDEVTRKRLELEREQNQLSMKQMLELGMIVGNFLQDEQLQRQESMNINDKNQNDNSSAEDGTTSNEIPQVEKSFWKTLTKKLLRRLGKHNYELLLQKESEMFLPAVIAPWPTRFKEQVEERVRKIQEAVSRSEREKERERERERDREARRGGGRRDDRSTPENKTGENKRSTDEEQGEDEVLVERPRDMKEKERRNQDRDREQRENKNRDRRSPRAGGENHDRERPRAPSRSRRDDRRDRDRERRGGRGDAAEDRRSRPRSRDEKDNKRRGGGDKVSPREERRERADRRDRRSTQDRPDEIVSGGEDEKDRNTTTSKRERRDKSSRRNNGTRSERDRGRTRGGSADENKDNDDDEIEDVTNRRDRDRERGRRRQDRSDDDEELVEASSRPAKKKRR
ncbi:unnamed protein product [Amoebophrya sp. A120]|nr:unnamed protein product [Amoebophrya sp. A120]|eukprot:GSA120T00000327001.1